MSKSLDFCKAVAQDVSRSRYTDRDWNNAIEFPETEELFDKYLHGGRNFSIDGEAEDGADIHFDASLSFNSNADFDYFASESRIHDGTLFFIGKVMDMLVRRVCLAQTYNKNIGAPEHGDHIRYTVGNFIILTECDGDFVPTDKPFLRERTTVLLPLKMTKG